MKVEFTTNSTMQWVTLKDLNKLFEFWDILSLLGLLGFVNDFEVGYHKIVNILKATCLSDTIGIFSVNFL